MKHLREYLIIGVAIIGGFLIISTKPNNNFTDNNPNLKVNKSSAAEGKQVYNISQNHNSPVFKQAIIDPENVQVGQTQFMSVSISDNVSIISVTATITTDMLTQEYVLDLTEGNDIDGVWQGSWVVHDTHNETYYTIFKATDNVGDISEVRLSWTDPGLSCPSTGNCTKTTGVFSVTGVDGADNGNLILSGVGTSITVSSSSSLVFNSGFSITIGTGVTIVINSTGKIQQGYICMTDADGDGYAPDYVQYLDTTSATCASVAGRKRRNLMNASYLTKIDCTGYDTNAAVYPGTNCTTPAWGACTGAMVCVGTQSRTATICPLATGGACTSSLQSQACNMAIGTQCSAYGTCTDNRVSPSLSCTGIQYAYTCDGAGTCNNATGLSQSCSLGSPVSAYRDVDVDGYGAGTLVSGCLGKGYVANNTDCCDANVLVNPGGTYQTTVITGCNAAMPGQNGSYDYNCNSSNEKQSNGCVDNTLFGTAAGKYCLDPDPTCVYWPTAYSYVGGMDGSVACGGAGFFRSDAHFCRNTSCVGGTTPWVQKLGACTQGCR